MGRVYNFSAGPAVLPEEVLREAADEMLDYRGTGMSVMEMSHRSKAFETIIEEAESDLRELMNIPDNYKVLFLQLRLIFLFTLNTVFRAVFFKYITVNIRIIFVIINAVINKIVMLYVFIILSDRQIEIYGYSYAYN